MIEVIIGNLILFHLFYLLSIIRKDFSIIDIAWGMSFFLIFFINFLNISEPDLRLFIIGVLVFIWAIRLSGYIFFRSLKKNEEDHRYAKWRKDWGDKANLIAYFKVFLLQAFLSLIMASPLILIFYYESEKPFGTALDFIGITVWFIGFIFESVGDYQKHKFKSQKENDGKVLKKGLWKYSRHPNYFGEAVMWWGIFFMTLSQNVPFYYAMIGPLILTIFLLKISGVSLLEEKYEGNTAYDLYKKETNAFIPWFPKDV